MMQTVDARGRSCPEPIMLTRQALLNDPSGVMVTVDNVCSVENIARFAGHQGYSFTKEEADGEFTLTLTKNG